MILSWGTACVVMAFGFFFFEILLLPPLFLPIRIMVCVFLSREFTAKSELVDAL